MKFPQTQNLRLNPRKALAATVVVACSILLILWYLQRPFQSELQILNISDHGQLIFGEAPVYKDCSVLESEWGSLVSSHGIKNSATFILRAKNDNHLANRVDEYILAPQCELLPGGHLATVYVGSQHLENFASIIHKVPFNFILISGDEDTTIPQDIYSYETILSSPKLLRWYTQNLGVSIVPSDGNDIEAKKLRYLPIGLDLHTLYLRPEAVAHWGPKASPIEQERYILQIAGAAPPVQQRKLQIFCNFQFTKPKSSTWYDSS